jgi:hypothetical protein
MSLDVVECDVVGHRQNAANRNARAIRRRRSALSALYSARAMR